MKLNSTQLAGPANPGIGYFYADSFAMYTSGGGTNIDPSNSLDWALRDGSGNPLYINFNIPYQMHANPSHPGWRSRLTEWILSQSRLGYWGVLLDDVNFSLGHIADGKGNIVPPVVGGVTLTDQSWAKMVSDFTACLRTEIKTIFPSLQIIHNSFWRDTPTKLDSWTEPLVLADWSSADLLMKENGFMDGGLAGGTGYWSLYNLLRWCDAVHAKGKGVLVLETDGSNPMYSIACSLLMTNGNDYWENRNFPIDNSTTSTLQVDLGKELSPRRRSPSGLWTRYFENGFVLVNEPSAPTQVVGGITLGPKSGVVGIQK